MTLATKLLNQYPNKIIPNSVWIDETCDMADNLMERKLGKEAFKATFMEENECIRFNDQAQDLFNEILDDIQHCLRQKGFVDDFEMEVVS